MIRKDSVACTCGRRMTTRMRTWKRKQVKERRGTRTWKRKRTRSKLQEPDEGGPVLAIKKIRIDVDSHRCTNVHDEYR